MRIAPVLCFLVGLLAVPAVTPGRADASSVPVEPRKIAASVQPRVGTIPRPGFADGWFRPGPRQPEAQLDEGQQFDRPECATLPVTATGLNDAVAAGLGTIVGMDYQRAFELDDGRVLWVFQDAYLARPNGSPRLVHNVGAIQQGMCFTALHSGSEGNPSPWIGAATTWPFQSWWWPLGGRQLSAEVFLLFVAEMSERGNHYLDNATPIATWTVEIDLRTFEADPLRPAPNASADLYGWDVAADDVFSYLFSHCYRQFGFAYLGHDACTDEIRVARQPLDDVHRQLEYWNGTRWTDDPGAAANVAPLVGPDGEIRRVNPMQIRRDGDRWIAVTKVGDWWGGAMYFDVAPAPTGPWTSVASMPIAPLGTHDETNTYFASFGPTNGQLQIVGLSNNRWDGRRSDVYRPRFISVPTDMWTAGLPYR